MKRDLDLIRNILKAVEAVPAGGVLRELEGFDDVDAPTFNEHVALLIDAGYLEGRVVRGNMGIAAVRVIGLTWQGHDFIAAARDERLWVKAKKAVLGQGAAFTMDLLLGWLKKEISGQLGL